MAIWSGFVDYSQIYSASRGGAWPQDGPFSLQPAFNSSLVDSTYDCKTRQNVTLTGQERQGDVQLKVSLFCSILTFGLCCEQGKTFAWRILGFNHQISYYTNMAANCNHENMQAHTIKSNHTTDTIRRIIM